MKKLLTMAVVLLALFSGIYLADQAGYIDIQPGDPPVAGPLYEVSFLLTSDTDRTEVSEILLDGGRTIVYVMGDAQMDGLGDLNLDIEVHNLNVDQSVLYDFHASLAFEDSVAASGSPVRNPIINRTTNTDVRDITWTWTRVTPYPSGSGSGDSFTSTFAAGVSNQLNVDIRMNPGVLDDMADDSQVKLVFSIGSKEMTVVLREA